MKFLRQAFATIAAIAFAAAGQAAGANDHVAVMVADAPVQYAPPAQLSMYSFADVYRLTVAGAATTDYQLRVASSEPQPPVRQLFPAASATPVQASSLFSIGAMPQPERWLLILSGLAAAAWVARRRLGNSF